MRLKLVDLSGGLVELDVTSIVVAAAIGAVLLLLADYALHPTGTPDKAMDLMTGAIVGAGVQVGVRLLGVS